MLVAPARSPPLYLGYLGTGRIRQNVVILGFKCPRLPLNPLLLLLLLSLLPPPLHRQSA